MKLIVGLGNPGQTFAQTRHNLGFKVVQRLGERRQVSIAHCTFSPVDERPASVHGDYRLGDTPVRLLMPLTMMNESGDAVRGLAVPAQELLIVCDDVNLPVGVLRLRPQGGAGGHHGLQSCLETLGTEQVARLRIGVGMEPLPSDLRNFVLSAFQEAERPVIAQAVEQAADACEAWVREGIEVAMNRYNRAQDQ